MNLADFPISVLQRQQPTDEQGAKLDTMTYESSRFDPRSRQRVKQRVTLETSSRHGLPTPADENVVLALLYVAKHTHNFNDPIVHFTPRQLFRVMGWAPNSRSYDRLRQVLRRLKALVVRYENSWWDMAGRAYEAELATGIICEYELGRQVAGKETGSRSLPCWVRWSPQFQQSLANGNLKKLDLEQLFALRLPTSQRMYRFLDKRFYQTQQLEMDLYDFACGHVGLGRVKNVAELKRRLTPALTELEGIGFLAPATPSERYQKVSTGVWRIRLQAGSRFSGPPTLKMTPEERIVPEPATAPSSPEAELAARFYELWDGAKVGRIGQGDLEQGRRLLAEHGSDEAGELLPHLVRVVRRGWPECRSFSGAAGKYLAEAVRAREQEKQRAQLRDKAKTQQEQSRAEEERLAEERRRLEAAWQALAPEQRQAIEERMFRKYPEHRTRPALLRTFCLEEFARVSGRPC